MKTVKKKTTKGKKSTKNVEKINPDLPVKPEGQLILTPEELDEVYANIFYVKEPPDLPTHVMYNRKERAFVPLPDQTKFVTADLKSTILFHETADAQTQIENELCKRPEDTGDDIDEEIDEMEEEEQQKQDQNYLDFYQFDIPYEEEHIPEEVNEGEFMNYEEYVGEINEIENEENSFLVTAIKDTKPKEKKEPRVVAKRLSEMTLTSLPIKKLCVVIKLKNNFNFFDRMPQTMSIDMRDKATNTPTTKRSNYMVNISVTEMYDLYEADFARIQEEMENDRIQKLMALMSTKSAKKLKKKTFTVKKEERSLLEVAIMFDKIVSLDETDAIAQDFRYYEDPSDVFRGRGEGTLMLMWTMVYEKARNLFVTDISWSPEYFDLIAVTLSIPQGHLPLDENPDIGYLCLWSLKNPTYPEFITQTRCGVMCLTFHPNHGHVLAVGLRDGGLTVYNVSFYSAEPQYVTDQVQTKHMGCVRQIVWYKDLPTGEFTFLSVSEDGTVCQWLLMKSEMIKIIKVVLTLDMVPEIELSGAKQIYYARGTSITFNPVNDKMYMIGTTEGYVFKCNMEWNEFKKRFQAHQMPVLRIDYNKFDPTFYLTCSEDYIVKLWDDESDTLLMTFDIKMAVSDVSWSPFSSTVFSVTTTTDCRIVFYDLNVSTREPVCNQLVQPANEYRLVRVAFNKRVPIIVIGSSRCTTVTFKLSPNLRATLKPPKKGPKVTPEELELAKLHKVLETIRG